MTQLNTADTSNRRWYLDALRVLAMSAVVLLHAASQSWYSVDFHSYDWQVLNIFDSATRWSVPVFVMVSGVLFLNPARKQPIKKLYGKNIARIVTILVVWGLFYALWSLPTDWDYESLYAFIETWIMGHYHMWFLYMLIGLYACVPFLRCITQREETTRYFLLLGLVLNIGIPFITGFGHLDIVQTLVGKLLIEIPMGYSFYFVLGFCLDKASPSKMQRMIIYALGAIGVIATASFTLWASLQSGEPSLQYYGNFSPFVMITSVAVFIGVKQLCFVKTLSTGMRKGVLALSRCTLGVYMAHAFFLTAFQAIGFDALSFNPLFATPLMALLAITSSFAVSFMLNKIPIVNRYIV